MDEEKRRRYGLVDQNIMTNPELSIEARAIYAILASYSNAKTRESSPSVQTLIKAAGISKDRFYKHMGQLIEHGIVRKGTMTEGRLKIRNVYVLNDNV